MTARVDTSPNSWHHSARSPTAYDGRAFANLNHVCAMNEAEKCLPTNHLGVKPPGTGFKDERGKKYGRLTVIELHSHGPTQFTEWKCLCDCGNEVVAIAHRLRSGGKKSCGCLAKETTGARSRTHGATGTAEWRIWQGIKNRCYNSSEESFKRYGGRGIKMCPSWKSSFEAFFINVGPRPTPAHSLDREDNDGDYTPENCRWATPREQGNNRRTNVRLEFNGRTQTLAQWERETGIAQTLIRCRVKVLGWSVERALTQKPRREIFRVKMESAQKALYFVMSNISDSEKARILKIDGVAEKLASAGWRDEK